MKNERHAIYLLFPLMVLICVILISAVSVEETEVVKSYELVEMFNAGAPVYVGHRALGYYFTYVTDGESTDEFVASEKAQEVLAEDEGPPTVEYVYKVQHYRFKAFGITREFDASPYLDQVRFVVPEGAIAEM